MDFRPQTFSEVLHREWSFLVDPTVSIEDRTAQAERLRPFLSSIDAYVTLKGPTQGVLPSLDWNSSFRKGYSLLFWIRPRLTDEPVVLSSEEEIEYMRTRILYKFSSHPDDSKAVGVCVTCAGWQASPDKTTVETTLTAYSLPHFQPRKVAGIGSAYSSFVRTTLQLKVNEWQLLGINHTNPYLKRPMWTVLVDGYPMGTGDLTYPICERREEMEQNQVLQNVVVGGAQLIIGPSKSDDQKSASELNAKNDSPHVRLDLDVASMSLYPDSIPSNIQAVVSEAGPNVSLQKAGRILPTLPPVPNWSKGSSMEGPKVGIPLTVHSAALDLQRLSGKFIFGVSALTARVLGQVGESQRLVCPLHLLAGSTEGTPRVGLIRPAEAIRLGEESLPVLYIAGHSSIFHALSEYLMHLPEAADFASDDLENRSRNLSVVLQEQHVLSMLVLPFFLSLCPPGRLYDLQRDLYLNSIRQLYALYSDNGAYAALLINMLAEYLSSGGARVHEEALQGGILHILTASLRLSLLRCQRAKFFREPPKSFEALVKRFDAINEEIYPQTRQESTSPSHVPPAVADACVVLLEKCCGMPIDEMDSLSPAMQIRRTSDLALTAVFGLALDFDLWGGDPEAAARVLGEVANRYGDVSVTAGYIIRSQVSVQYFLDCIRLRFDGIAASSALEEVATSLGRLLQSMLLSSLSNRRSISQGEHDISACMSALTDSPLGSVGAHVVLTALVGVLAWCEVLPAEVSQTVDEPGNDDEQKMQLASRMGRNLLMAQFHDVVAPMILSRTAFSGERVLATKSSKFQGHLSWQNHWQLSVLLFSWVSSLAGTEGLIAAKTAGSLLFASGVAGSLKGALYGADRDTMNALLLPPPAIALMIGSTIRDEWSYTDLLSDRLQIMMPMLPGMVISLISTFSNNAELRYGSVVALSELMGAVGATFHRVFGGMIHSTSGSRKRSKQRREGISEASKAAKTYVPHLLTIVIVLEDYLLRTLSDSESRSGQRVRIMRPKTSTDDLRRTDMESWVDLSSESVVNEVVLQALENEEPSDADVIRVLESCEYGALNTSAGLLSNAMIMGGATTSVGLWQSVLTILRDSRGYVGGGSDSTKVGDEKPKTETQAQKGKTVEAIAESVLCRLVAIVLVKSLKRDYQWEIWSSEQSSAVAGLCVLLEEKQLLRVPHGIVESDGTARYNGNQILLVSALLDMLEYGRDATGWCQLALPAMTGGVQSKSAVPLGDLSEASKLLLPVLFPAIRVLLGSIQKLSPTQTVIIPTTSSSNDASEAVESEEYLLARVLSELKSTLTAAIVGLTFSSARDIALNAMATMRCAMDTFKQRNETGGADQCAKLLCAISEELRQRYKAERRLRETALFDAYEKTGDQAKSAEESIAIERLLLGGDVSGVENAKQEIDFTQTSSENKVSDDFVLFHQPHGATQDNPGLGFAQYEGLGAALEECGDNPGSHSSVDTVISALAPYLDAWDETARKDLVETELVGLFDTPDDDAPTDGSSGENDNHRVVLHSSETAADAMTTFFEFAASEKSRLRELSHRFLPSARYSRISYCERFCWARYMELDFSRVEGLWEYGVPDGNRDIRSRVMTIPFAPQFRRHIPKYLDHGAGVESKNNAPAKTEERHNFSSQPAKLNELTKTLLEAGNLEIVDITKQELDDDEGGLDLAMGTNELPRLDEDDEGLFDDPEDQEDATRKKGEATGNEQEEDVTLLTEDATDEDSTFVPEGGKISHHSITSSAFATPPDNASSSLGLMHSAAAGMIELHIESCFHVRAEGNRMCAMLLTATHLILEYDADSEGFYDGELLAVQEETERHKMASDEGGTSKEQDADEQINHRSERRQREVAALRPKSIRWNLSEVSHIYLRRYRLRDSSIEIFFIPSGGASFGGPGLFSASSSVFLDFGGGQIGKRRRNDAAYAMMKRAPPQAIKQWPDRSAQFLNEQISRLTMGWVEGRVSNFDYLLHLNILSGRSYNDICQYPVFPWVLADYTSKEIPDLTDSRNFRDLSKPVGALNPERLEEFLERFKTFADPSIPPFMYGSHYSTSAGVVLHFLVRLHPFAGLHRQLQSGHFDVADRLFSSVPRTWSMCTGQSAAEVKELTPEWYCNPSFLRNCNGFKLGTSQDGEKLNDVELPPWADGSPEKFVDVMRAALESDVCSEMLPDWIDLIFGRKQQGPEAIKANNVFFYLTYYGSVDVASIKDESLRQATELQIAHFGQCPMQLFKRAHVRRFPRQLQRPSFFQLISLHSQHTPIKGSADEADGEEDSKMKYGRAIFSEPTYLPFFSAPISNWIHLDAPPPGPHAPLISVRLAGIDRCLAVDAKGIFHTFRWAWRAEESLTHGDIEEDRGCFVAQRELPRFRIVPKLMFTPSSEYTPAVAISKTLFAGKSVLLVLSAGDARGSLGMQLVDPAKGSVRGEVVIPIVHSARITCIATDPIGTASGQGGVGGELAVVGSADGNASLWRFMSSHYLPLRPRNRISGHNGYAIHAVALCSAIQVVVTVSTKRCCIHSIGNGTMIRSFGPPSNTFDFPDSVDVKTSFGACQALAVSCQGYIVAVCETTVRHVPGSEQKVTTLHLYNLDGVCLGSQPLETWRGLPHKMQCTPDGTIVFVCTGRGVTVHRLSAVKPLEFVDEWQITELDDVSSGKIPGCYDMDLGPSLNKPVCAAAACSEGVLRIHALPGISAFSERHKKSGITQTMGSAFAFPGKRLNRAVRESLGIGTKIADMGRDIGKEVTTDVKEKGVGGFLGSMLFGKGSK